MSTIDISRDSHGTVKKNVDHRSKIEVYNGQISRSKRAVSSVFSAVKGVDALIEGSSYYNSI